MEGSLTIHNDVVWVGQHGKTAHVSAWDLGGRPLEGGFRFRDERVGHSKASDIAVDDDHRLWVADTPGHRPRAFSLFGRQVASLGLDPTSPRTPAFEDLDRPAEIRRPVAVVVDGAEQDLRVLVGSAGIRRHALQLFDASGELTCTLRSRGDQHAKFGEITSVDLLGEWIVVAERVGSGSWNHPRGRVQVYRHRDHHFDFERPASRRAFQPMAVALLEDGRFCVLDSGSNEVVLFSCEGEELNAWRVAAGEDVRPCAMALEPLKPLEAAGQSDGPSQETDHQRRVVLLDPASSVVHVHSLAGQSLARFSVARRAAS